MDLTDIYRVFHPKEAEYNIHFMCTWSILQDWQNLGHKMSFSEFNKTEVLSHIFSYYSNMRLEVN